MLENKERGSIMGELLFSYAKESRTHTREGPYENEALDAFLIRLHNYYRCNFCGKNFENSKIQAAVAHTKGHHWKAIVAKEMEEREKICKITGKTQNN